LKVSIEEYREGVGLRLESKEVSRGYKEGIDNRAIIARDKDKYIVFSKFLGEI
jgi:hypothetical protein